MPLVKALSVEPGMSLSGVGLSQVCSIQKWSACAFLGLWRWGWGLGLSLTWESWRHHCSYASIYSQSYHSSDLTILLTIIWCHCQPIWRAHEQFWLKHRDAGLMGSGSSSVCQPDEQTRFFQPSCWLGSHHRSSDWLGGCWLSKIVKNNEPIGKVGDIK